MFRGLIEALGVDGRLVEPDLASEIGLRQRRAFVGSNGFLADEDHPSLETLRP